MRVASPRTLYGRKGKQSMGFFNRNFNKPGPGVPKNAPKKRGFARFWEIFMRDMGSLFKLNLLMMLVLLPAGLLYVLFVLNYLSGNFGTSMVFGLLSFVVCLPLGPALTAFYWLLAQMLRDEPGFLWHDFKRKFRENFRHMAIPGMLLGAMAGSLGLILLYTLLGAAPASLPMTALFFLAALLVSLFYPYFFTQAAYIDLPPWRLLQNSFLLAFANLPRSLVGTLLGTGLLLAQLFFFPFAVPLSLFVGFTLPGLLNLMWIWPRINQTFKIDETLKKRHDEQLEEINRVDFE